MPINVITVDRTVGMGSDLYDTILQLRNAQGRLSMIKDMMDNMTDAVDYATIEAQYGIPIGKGVTTYNLVSGAVADLTADVSFNQLIDWFALKP